MYHTIIMLPGGSELSSGPDAQYAIRSATITRSVNDGKNLNAGSVMAGKLDLEFISPEGGLTIAAGTELAVYKADDQGNRRLLGRYLAETPTRPSANVLRLTAYDRVCFLDKDLSQWLEGLESWPYRLYDLANMVCQACGLELVNDQILNGDFPVQPFFASRLTGRQLMRWICEAAGMFCRATAEGEIELAWYAPGTIAIGPEETDGGLFYYENGLSFADFTTAPIEKVQIRQKEDDVGTVYPDAADAANTWVIQDNPLLAAVAADTLNGVAENLYEHLKEISYTPCSITIPACLDIAPGQILSITDRNGKTITAWIMTVTWMGSRMQLECTGERTRESVAAVNDQSYGALHKKLLRLRTDVDGMVAENRETVTDLSTLRESVGALSVDTEAVKAGVSRLTGSVDDLGNLVSSVENKVSTLVTAEKLEAAVSTVVKGGVEKVSTTTGTFDELGLTIRSTGSATMTQVTPDGMVVSQEATGAEVLTATGSGVDATNLHAKTYLIIGDRSRFENYGSDRTGCFWIGGD